jgi:predicted GNAT family acetyltransferase
MRSMRQGFHCKNRSIITSLVELHIIDNPAKNRFEAHIQEDVAYLEYHKFHNEIALVHTFVPEKFRHQGIAYALIRFGLDLAIEQKLRVIPYCSSIVKFLEEHPEYNRRLEFL